MFWAHLWKSGCQGSPWGEPWVTVDHCRCPCWVCGLWLGMADRSALSACLGCAVAGWASCFLGCTAAEDPGPRPAWAGGVPSAASASPSLPPRAWVPSWRRGQARPTLGHPDSCLSLPGASPQRLGLLPWELWRTGAAVRAEQGAVGLWLRPALLRLLGREAVLHASPAGLGPCRPLLPSRRASR